MNSSLWNLVNEWYDSESHERHICADQLAKSLLKERLSQWRNRCTFTYSGDLSDLGINSFDHIHFFKPQGG